MPEMTALAVITGPPPQVGYRGPRIIAVAGNRGHLWGEQHRIETRTKRIHSRVNSGRLTIGGNYSRSPLDYEPIQESSRPTVRVPIYPARGENPMFRKIPTFMISLAAVAAFGASVLVSTTNSHACGPAIMHKQTSKPAS